MWPSLSDHKEHDECGWLKEWIKMHYSKHGHRYPRLMKQAGETDEPTGQ